MIEFFKGFYWMMRLTEFHGPWAYENLERVEAKEPETFYELGERAAAIMVRAAAIMVRADEVRKHDAMMREYAARRMRDLGLS